MSRPSVKHLLGEITDERLRQDDKFGEQNHDPFFYASILMEELGEFCQVAIEAHARSWSDEHLAKVRAEAVQVAAVALAILECLDRDRWTWGGHAQDRDAAMPSPAEGVRP